MCNVHPSIYGNIYIHIKWTRTEQKASTYTYTVKVRKYQLYQALYSANPWHMVLRSCALLIAFNLQTKYTCSSVTYGKTCGKTIP